MRTLDEVIKAFEICIVDNGGTCKGCPYSDENGEPICIGDDKEDALFYLKEYRWVQDNCADALAEKFPNQNPPLTWNELKQMLGKPVWVEHKHYSKWLIVYEVYENTIVLDGNGYYTQYFSDDNDKEVRWKAYRRER